MQSYVALLPRLLGSGLATYLPCMCVQPSWRLCMEAVERAVLHRWSAAWVSKPSPAAQRRGWAKKGQQDGMHMGADRSQKDTGLKLAGRSPSQEGAMGNSENA